MAYYDTLIAKWPSVPGATTTEKLAALNAETIEGPRVNVGVSSVLGFLMLSGAYLKLGAFAGTNPTGDATHDAALFATKLLMALLSNPNAPQFNMSDPATFAALSSMLDAIQAYEAAVPGATGLTQALRDGLVALSATMVPWWQANGYSSTISDNDLIAAGGLS